MAPIENTLCGDIENDVEATHHLDNITNMTMKHCLEDGPVKINHGGAFASDVMGYAIFIIMLLIALFTVIGNVAIIACVLKSPHLSSSNYSIYVVSLGVSDLMIGFICIPALVIYTALGYWPLGWEMCALYNICDSICLSVSNLHLNVIAYDRFQAVTDPFAYMSKFTRSRARKLAVVAWLVPMLYYCPPIIYAFVLDELQGTSISGQCYYTSYTWGTVGVVVLNSYGPPVGLIIMYMCLMFAMNRRGQSQRRLQQPTQSKDAGVAITSNHVIENVVLKDIIRIQSRRCLITLLTQIILFLLCWIPWMVVWPIYTLCETCVPASVYEVSYWLVYLNSTGNPVLYLIFNKDYRKVMIGMFTYTKDML